MDMGRPKGTDYPPYMTVDGDRGGWIVRSPITGKKKRFNDEGQARAAAIKLHQWIENERRSEACGAPASSGHRLNARQMQVT